MPVKYIKPRDWFMPGMSLGNDDASKLFYGFTLVLSVLYVYFGIANMVRLSQTGMVQGAGLPALIALFYVGAVFWFIWRDYSVRNYVVPIIVLLYGAVDVLLWRLAYTSESASSVAFQFQGIGVTVVFLLVALVCAGMLFGKMPSFGHGLFSLPYRGAFFGCVAGLLWQITNLGLLDSFFASIGYLFALPGAFLNGVLSVCMQPQYIDYGPATGCQAIIIVATNVILLALAGYVLGLIRSKRSATSSADTSG